MTFTLLVSSVLVVVAVFVAVVTGAVLVDLVYVRRRVPLTALLAVPLGLVAAASWTGSTSAEVGARWGAAGLLAIATWVGAADDNRHPRRPHQGASGAGALATLVGAAAFSCAVVPDALPIAGVIALGGAGLVATRQRVPEQLEPTLGPSLQVGAAICFLLAVCFAASTLPEGAGPTRALALASAVVITVVHLKGTWMRVEPYPWSDVAGVAALVSFVALAGL